MGNTSSGDSSNRSTSTLLLPPGLKRQLNSNNPNSNQGPLRFHASSHGENIRVSRDGIVARRVDSFCKGIAFSNRNIRTNEYILLKLVEISTTWSGVVRFGFTNQDPIQHRANLPKYACPDLTNRPGYWAKALPDRMVERDVILFYYVTESGEVHYGVNGEEKGIFFSGVDTRKPLWALFDIYGNTVALEIIDPRRQPNVSEIPPEIPSISDHADTSKYFPNVCLKSMPFHSTHGKYIRLSNDRLTAARVKTEYSQGYVFTERPMRCGEQFIIRVLANVNEYFGSLTFGLTTCDPTTLNPAELPEDCDQLLDRQEYWVVIKDVALVPQPGDELSFLLTAEGEVVFSKNNARPKTVLHIDHTQKLWAFFDVYGITLKIKSLGCSVMLPKQLSNFDTVECVDNNLENADDECMMCCERKINSVLYTCGHMCMCYECAEQHLKKPTGNWCPICRAEVQDIIRTYRS